MTWDLEKNEKGFNKIMSEMDKICKRNDLLYVRKDKRNDGEYIRGLMIDLMYAENLLALLQKRYEISDEEMKYQFGLTRHITGNMCKRYELYVSKRYELKPLMATEKKTKKITKHK